MASPVQPGPVHCLDSCRGPREKNVYDRKTIYMDKKGTSTTATAMTKDRKEASSLT